MKYIKNLFAATIILLFTASFATLPADWYLFDAKGFSVEFPKKPNTAIQNVPSEIGELKMEISMYDASENKEAKDDNLVYGLITTEYPDSLINSDKTTLLTAFFRNSIDGAVKNVEGELLSEKNIEAGGFPGRETRTNYKNGLAIIKMRMYLVHNKMFILQTITETAKEQNTDALRFLNSFKLK